MEQKHNVGYNVEEGFEFVSGALNDDLWMAGASACYVIPDSIGLRLLTWCSCLR